uniref:Acyl-ACP thioesterase-like C-terminal domain-containing protein n=1 Tax=Salix viminalis TaxID=40686 RepID=A0A6N2M3L1_SALVM
MKIQKGYKNDSRPTAGLHLSKMSSLKTKQKLHSRRIVSHGNNDEFEAELDKKRKLVEEEIEAKKRAWELREFDLKQREDIVLEKEHDLEVQSRALVDKEKDVTDKINFLDDKERSLNVAEKDIELKRALLLQEREEINKTKLELQKSLDYLEDKRKQVDCVKLQTLTSETNEFAALEMKLKGEVDIDTLAADINNDEELGSSLKEVLDKDRQLLQGHLKLVLIKLQHWKVFSTFFRLTDKNADKTPILGVANVEHHLRDDEPTNYRTIKDARSKKKTFQEEIPENINKLNTNAIFTNSNSMPKRSDLDMNHHVNNVRYVNWMLETIPRKFLENYRLTRITLEYRRECSSSDMVQSLVKRKKGEF